MKNLNKRLPFIKKLLSEKETASKVYLYFSTKTTGDDYDNYEKNYIYTDLNPLCIKAYIREVSPQALVYKQYGLAETGAKELICDSKYKTWFEKCNRVVIDDKDYQVYKEASSSRALITERPFKTLYVVLAKKETE